MRSADGRFVLVFNGEIYNYRALRDELVASGRSFRSQTDTEVILEAISEWGFASTLKRLNGMFAIAVWDRRESLLHLARDRMGEKPLYYGRIGDSVIFGSELKALRAHPAFKGEIDRQALALYLRHNYIPAPISIYKGVNKLPPATYVTIDAQDEVLREPVAFWSAAQAAREGTESPFQDPESQIEEKLDFLLRDAVKLRMQSDVPLGAFLSGGIDSSLVVALMQAQSERPVRTFTIGFHEVGYNEAQHAKTVAHHLGTDHTELYLTPDEAMSVVPDLSHVYDEPFSDSSQIPTMLVSRLAREHVIVSLSGDGGDELFGGYDRYFLADAIFGRSKRLPDALRTTIARGLTSLSPQQWNLVLRKVRPLLPVRLRSASGGDRVHRLAATLADTDPDSLYARLVSHWDPADVLLGTKEPPFLMEEANAARFLGTTMERAMLLDSVTYLPGDILTKVDRASMAYSLEARVPLLDHRVFEFAWRVPLDLKIRGKEGKWLLRKLLGRYLPPHLFERPKMGFGVPIDAWLRGPLKEWAADLLNPSRLLQEGFFDPSAVQQKWKEHLDGSGNWHYHLWDVLMFESWLDASVTPSFAPAP
jgi:asparagine synthase (glutamine-hydrolysing)